MAFFHDIVVREGTQRHELIFVNQQYDYLMGIYFDEVAGKYVLSCSPEVAQNISKEWGGGDFDVDDWMKFAEEKLTEADNGMKASSSWKNS
jgi:hypothetical protein